MPALPSCGVGQREAAVAEALRLVAEACNRACLASYCRGAAAGAGGPLAALERLAAEAARRGCPEEAMLQAALERLKGLLGGAGR